jgi:alpha-beta hydrolase superfamily lysophospholipase
MGDYFSTKEYKAKNTKKILFFFPAGFTKMWQYRWTVFLLNRMGITVIGFDFSWRKAIRECNFTDLINLIKQVDQVVGETITKNPPSMQYAVLGLSFGSVFSLYTAKRHKSIKSIILFVPYGTLSNLLWTHKPSKPFIATLMKNGLKSEQELEKLTQPVETQYQLDNLKDRRIVSFLGKSDKIVFDGAKLVDAIKEQNIDATFYKSRFGHFGTSALGILRKSKWDQIL